MSELLRSTLAVVLVTQVARVLILVAATKGQWDDVINYRGSNHAALGDTVLAESVGAPEPACALLHTCPTAEPASHQIEASRDRRR